nr:helix-turn-helix domain-containing protein [Psychrobacter sp. WY6]
MKINKAYKFRLEPNTEQEVILNNLVGSARFFGIKCWQSHLRCLLKMSLLMPPIWLIKL